MGEPKRKENCVVLPIRLPFEEIGKNVPDVCLVQAPPVDFHHFWRSIDDRQALGRRNKPLAPKSGASCKLQHIAGWVELGETGSYLFDLMEPSPIGLFAPIIAALPKKPLVVFGGPFPIIVDLPKKKFRFHRVKRIRARIRLDKTPSGYLVGMFLPLNLPMGASSPRDHWLVCIDPGHPSEVGRGTQGRKLTEIEVAWSVANLLKSDLELQGVRVVMTKHTQEQFVSNRARAAVANKAGADLMVRLHCDAANGSGFTTYFPDQVGHSQGFAGPSASLLSREPKIAQAFQHRLASELRGFLRDNGLKGDEDTAVGRKQGALTGSIFSQVPVVLVEMVVLTNRSDEEKVETRQGRNRLAHALAAATMAALESEKGTS